MADPTQATAYYADGTAIPEAELADAVASGKARFRKGEKVYVHDSTGRLGTVNAEDAYQMLQSGGSLASQQGIQQTLEKKRFGESPVEAAKAFGEGAVSGLTLGLIDPLTATPEARARARYNPTARTAGEVVGTVAPLIASGGTGAIAKGVATAGALPRGVAALGGLAERAAVRGAGAIGLTGESLAGRALVKGIGMGTGGAVEGALYGAGEAVRESALGDHDLTAEQVLSSMGRGALFGGGLGSVIGGGSALVGGAGRAVVRRMAEGADFQGALKGFAEKRAFKQLTGNARKFYDEATSFGKDPTRLRRIGRKVLDRDIPLGKLEHSAAALRRETDDAVSRMQSVAKELDSAGVRVDVRSVLRRVDEQVAKIRETPLAEYAKVARRIESEVKPLRKAVTPGEALDTAQLGIVRRGPDGELVPARAIEATPGKEFTFSEFWAVRKKLDATIKWSAKQANPATDALRDLRRQFDDALTETLEAQRAIVPVEGAGYRVAGAVEDPRSLLADKWKAAKEDFHDLKTVQDAVEDLQLRTEKNRFYSASDYGTGTAMGLITGLLTGGLSTGAMAAMGIGAAATAVHKLIRERGSGVVAKMADNVAKMQGRVDSGVKQLAGKGPAETVKRALVPVSSSAEELRDRYRQIDKAVATFKLDPRAAITRLAEPVKDIARPYPALAMSIQQAIQADHEYLAAMIPRPFTRAGHSLTPHLETQRVPVAAMRKVVAAAEALEDPSSVIDQLIAGRVPRDAIEALKARRPGVFAHIREQVMTEVSQRQETLPYKRRVLLSLAFDFAGDWSLAPENLKAIQQATTQPQEQAAPGGQQPPPSGPPLDPKLSSNMQLEPRRVAGGA